MRRLLLSAALLLLAACGSAGEGPGTPPDLTNARYSLQAVDGTVYGVGAISAARGTLAIAGDRFTETFQVQAAGSWSAEYADTGTVVLRGDSVILHSARYDRTHSRGVAGASSMSLRGGSWVFHWRKQ